MVINTEILRVQKKGKSDIDTFWMKMVDILDARTAHKQYDNFVQW